MVDKLDKLKKNDRQEQNSIRNYILIHRVSEKQNEDLVIKTFHKQMQIEIEKEDIDRSHRLGKCTNSNGRSRPITVKFARYNALSKVFKSKKRT